MQPDVAEGCRARTEVHDVGDDVDEEKMKRY